MGMDEELLPTYDSLDGERIVMVEIQAVASETESRPRPGGMRRPLTEASRRNGGSPSRTEHMMMVSRSDRCCRFQGGLRVSWALAAVLVATVCLGACSDGRDAASTAARDGELTIVATDDGYEFPSEVREGWVHVTFENHGSTIHEAMFIKLPEDMTAEEYLEEVRSGTDFPEGALDYSGPGLTSPGLSIEVWVELEAGNYILACWFRGHLLRDPVQRLTVVADPSFRTEPPREDVTLRLLDYRYELNGEFSEGPQVIRVETPGPSMHEFDIFLLDDGKSVEDLWLWYRTGQEGPAPARALGGVMDNHDIERVVWLRTHLRPGRYVLWCGLPLTTDGSGTGGEASHGDAGMFHRFTIPP